MKKWKCNEQNVFMIDFPVKLSKYTIPNGTRNQCEVNYLLQLVRTLEMDLINYAPNGMSVNSQKTLQNIPINRSHLDRRVYNVGKKCKNKLLQS